MDYHGELLEKIYLCRFLFKDESIYYSIDKHRVLMANVDLIFETKSCSRKTELH